MSDWLYPVAAGLVRSEHAGEIVSPAYDLLLPAKRLDHSQRHPRSFLNGTPSEADDSDLDYQSRRAQARSYLQTELEAGLKIKVGVPDVARLSWVEVRAVESQALIPAIVDLGPGEAEVIGSDCRLAACLPRLSRFGRRLVA